MTTRERIVRRVQNFLWNNKSAEQVADEIIALVAGSRNPELEAPKRFVRTVKQPGDLVL